MFLNENRKCKIEYDGDAADGGSSSSSGDGGAAAANYKSTKMQQNDDDDDDECKDDNDVHDIKSINTQLTWKMKKRLLDLRIEYPTCSYTENSRRRRPRDHHRRIDGTLFVDDERVNLYNDLKTMLRGFNTARVICIDGMNGTGKSTITSKINRRYCKINEYCPTVTAGSDYNYYIMNAFQYINYQLIHNNNNNDNGDAVVWDRDRYSNLRFYFVHYLMNEYRDRVMSIDDEDEVYEKLNTMALATHLLDTLTFYEKMKPSPPTLVLVCDDLKILGHVLLLRGGVSGTVMSKITNYQVAQYHVYRYFAKILRTPILDIAAMSRDYNVTLNELQALIMNCIDFVKDASSDDCRCKRLRRDDTTSDRLIIIDGIDKTEQNETFIRLQEFCKRNGGNNDRALYTYSLK